MPITRTKPIPRAESPPRDTRKGAPRRNLTGPRATTPEAPNTGKLREEATAEFFRLQDDGTIRCPACVKLNSRCIEWLEDGRSAYRPRALRTGEYLVEGELDGFGPCWLIVTKAAIDGIEYFIAAEETLCAAGLLIVTGWTISTLRDCAAHLPGRVLPRPGKKSKKAIQSHRRPPTPLIFRTSAVYQWLARQIQPAPRDRAEFVKLVATIHRRSTSEPFEAVLHAYADEIKAFFREAEKEGK